MSSKSLIIFKESLKRCKTPRRGLKYKTLENLEKYVIIDTRGKGDE